MPKRTELCINYEARVLLPLSAYLANRDYKARTHARDINNHRISLDALLTSSSTRDKSYPPAPAIRIRVHDDRYSTPYIVPIRRRV